MASKLDTKVTRMKQVIGTLKSALTGLGFDMTGTNILTFFKAITDVPRISEWTLITGSFIEFFLSVYRVGMKIRPYAFRSIGSKLRKVTLDLSPLSDSDQARLGDGSLLSEIGEGAFYGCARLDISTIQTFVSNTRTIRNRAFDGCQTAGTLHISDYLGGSWNIATNAFAGLPYMSIVVDDLTNEQVTSLPGYPYVWGLTSGLISGGVS